MSAPRTFACLLLLLFGGLAAVMAQGSSTTILTRDQAGPLLPATVFYQGKVAPVQARNSAGLRSADSRLTLAALVDTSGYASSIQQVYQAYLLTEVKLRIGDHVLPPGAYGFGFLPGDRFVVMDLGGNEVLSASTQSDAQMARPTPLQILADPASPARFRLFLGRRFATLELVAK